MRCAPKAPDYIAAVILIYRRQKRENANSCKMRLSTKVAHKVVLAVDLEHTEGKEYLKMEKFLFA